MKGGEQVPKTVNCPVCNTEMKKNEHGIWVCEDCGGAFVPKSRHVGPESIFGVHQ